MAVVSDREFEARTNVTLAVGGPMTAVEAKRMWYGSLVESEDRGVLSRKGWNGRFNTVDQPSGSLQEHRSFAFTLTDPWASQPRAHDYRSLSQHQEMYSTEHSKRGNRNQTYQSVRWDIRQWADGHSLEGHIVWRDAHDSGLSPV